VKIKKKIAFELKQEEVIWREKENELSEQKKSRCVFFIFVQKQPQLIFFIIIF
jgi:hypothetical protein